MGFGDCIQKQYPNYPTVYIKVFLYLLWSKAPKTLSKGHYQLELMPLLPLKAQSLTTLSRNSSCTKSISSHFLKLRSPWKCLTGGAQVMCLHICCNRCWTIEFWLQPCKGKGHNVGISQYKKGIQSYWLVTNITTVWQSFYV